MHLCLDFMTIPRYADCQEAFEDGRRYPGVYTLQQPDIGTFSAWCDFDESFGWTVIQRRIDGSVDFQRNWDQFKAGFGDLKGEYWLGR